MKKNGLIPILALLAFAAVAATSGAAPASIAQEGAKPEGTKKGELPMPPIEVGPQAGSEEDAAHAEIERLFGEVERRMRKVNRLLEDASAGGRRSTEARQEVDGAIRAIDELLRETQASSRAAVEGIDKILELADHPHSGGT